MEGSEIPKEDLESFGAFQSSLLLQSTYPKLFYLDSGRVISYPTAASLAAAHGRRSRSLPNAWRTSAGVFCPGTTRQLLFPLKMSHSFSVIGRLSLSPTIFFPKVFLSRTRKGNPNEVKSFGAWGPCRWWASPRKGRNFGEILRSPFTKRGALRLSCWVHFWGILDVLSRWVFVGWIFGKVSEW